MSKRPVLSATGNFPGLRIDGYHAAAGKRSEVRPAMLVESHVPCCDGAAPVVENVAEDPTPLAPIRKIARVGVVGATFRPVHLRIWISVVDFAYHVGSAVVAVPGDSVHVPAKFVVLQ